LNLAVRGISLMNGEATHKPAHDPQDLARLLASREQAGDVEGMATGNWPAAKMLFEDFTSSW
jgi:hypothetical protein